MLNQDESNLKLFIDGAARNNPGPAGAGIHIKRNGHVVFNRGYFLGSKTNNEAEYLSLILGLLKLQNFINDKEQVKIISDSQLLVRQILGQYKVKKPELQKLYIFAMSILRKMNYTIEHVLRDQNKEADKNANQAIDKKLSLDSELINILKENGISIN